ncbi:RNA-directed DNA polymerase, eukaryota [Tanacetum coccineum]
MKPSSPLDPTRSGSSQSAALVVLVVVVGGSTSTTITPQLSVVVGRICDEGDPLAPYLFILIMESLHLSICRLVDNGLFKGIQLPGSVNISHLFYADDAMLIGEWSDENLKVILYTLKSFFLASGLSINIHKSQLLGVGVPHQVVQQVASSIGCSIMQKQFRYLGVTIGDRMSRNKAWENVIDKLRSRLSKWKVKTLSIGGRLTLLKSVLGASPIYSMSIFKVPRGVLKIMEAIRSRFFNGIGQGETKFTWIAWNKVLASKERGGLGVSSFFALNRALLLKWVWSWIGDSALHVKFPRLFALELDKDISVAVKMNSQGVAHVVTETTWLRNLLRELHSPLATTTLVYYDNGYVLMSETFQVAAIIEKLPPSWVEFKNYLKHKRKEMSVEDLVHAGSSSRFNSKGNKKDKKKNDKKGKGKSEYLAPKAGIVKQKFQGTYENVDMIAMVSDVCAMISEVNLVGTNNSGWWIDTGATRHVCADKSMFHSFRAVDNGQKLYMGNSATADIKGEGDVILKMTS